jgi:glycosyltransferase involved in cell wall biosynthesis
MKIMFLCNLVPGKAGAFERFIEALGKQCRAKGDALCVVLAGPPIEVVAGYWRAAGVRWEIIPRWISASGAPRPWGVVWPALKMLQQERPDVAVVHFGNELPSLTLSLLAPLFGIRNLKWVWQQDQQMSLPGRITRWVSRIRLLGMRFNRFVVVYEGGREAMEARGLLRRRITVIHNGVADPEPEQNRERVRSWLLREAKDQQEVSSQKSAVRSQNKAEERECGCGKGKKEAGDALRENAKDVKGDAKTLDDRLEIIDWGDRENIYHKDHEGHKGGEDYSRGILPESEKGMRSEEGQELILMSVGSMIPRKRQDFIIEVFAEISKPKTKDQRLWIIGQGDCGSRSEVQCQTSSVFPLLRLVLIGDGPERVRLEALVRRLGVEGKVTFLGARNDVSTLLCGADIFVHAATAEGCAYVLAEAMAAGVPMVVTDAGAAHEQVAEGVNGFVVESEDEVMFAESVRVLIRDDAMRERMGASSRARWAKGFKVEEQARAYVECYREL